MEFNLHDLSCCKINFLNQHAVKELRLLYEPDKDHCFIIILVSVIKIQLQKYRYHIYIYIQFKNILQNLLHN